MTSAKWVSLGIFFLVVSSFAEKAPYTSFAKNATSAPPLDYYDYIIIGGGTAGCSLAATLSSAAKVLVLERGGVPYGNPDVTKITGFLKLLVDTSPSSASQLFVSTDGVFNHRARVLGGGSAINAGFYSRASAEYVREAGWDPRLVNQSYEWVEQKVAHRPRIQQWQAAVRDGLVDAAGVTPFNGITYEHLLGTKVGGSIFDENGIRHTAADLLEYADQAKIAVYLHATVHRILFKTSPGQRPKADGVLFKDSKGQKHRVYLNRGAANEIILSAGAMASPHLLMLSGIGPGPQLRAKGINVVMEQPLVGQSMSDNPTNAFLIPTRRPVEISLVQVVGISDVGNFIEAASGFVGLSSIYDFVQDYANHANKTVEPFMIPTNETIQQILERSKANQALSAPVAVVLQKIMGPFSTGYMELESKDPTATPKVTFNYFKDARDLAMCVKGVEILKKVIQSKAMSEFLDPWTTFEALQSFMLFAPINLREKHASALYSMEQYCKDTVLTLWHYHGGCQVGRVVDRDYRVIGVDSLRVVDGSTFISSPGTNPQATVMMLGRYVGRRILQKRNPRRRN